MGPVEGRVIDDAAPTRRRAEGRQHIVERTRADEADRQSVLCGETTARHVLSGIKPNGTNKDASDPCAFRRFPVGRTFLTMTDQEFADRMEELENQDKSFRKMWFEAFKKNDKERIASVVSQWKETKQTKKRGIVTTIMYPGNDFVWFESSKSN